MRRPCPRAEDVRDVWAKVVPYTGYGEDGLPSVDDAPDLWAEISAALAA